MSLNPSKSNQRNDKYSFTLPPNCPGSKITWFCGSEGEDRYFSDRRWRCNPPQNPGQL